VLKDTGRCGHRDDGSQERVKIGELLGRLLAGGNSCVNDSALSPTSAGMNSIGAPFLPAFFKRRFSGISDRGIAE